MSAHAQRKYHYCRPTNRWESMFVAGIYNIGHKGITGFIVFKLASTTHEIIKTISIYWEHTFIPYSGHVASRININLSSS